MAQIKVKGSDEVKSFYNSKGWKKTEEGKYLDTDLFESKGTGPIANELEVKRRIRLKNFIRHNEKKINFLEAGCGANPATFMLDLCAKYTGVDFSETGIEETNEILKKTGATYEVAVADICQLPFPDDHFDTVYTAHVLYHIPDSISQKKAFDEIMRVTKKGGTSLFILANPRPILFPIRFFKRFIIDMPVVGDIINKIRPKAVLPYKPHTIGWMKKVLKNYGEVSVISYGLSSTYLKQHVSEHNFFGKTFWKTLAWLELDHPKASAYLGNYVALIAKKN
ncbi:MAG: class I SAM-dependent methyltransferase [Bacteroidales bacterium]